MSKFIKPLRFMFKYIVPACFAVVLVFKILTSPEIDLLDSAYNWYLDIAYKILLSSMVGYFTNFLAITMLFKPKDRTRHGIQGLIPSNQDQIAESLGEGIADNFFNAKDLINYVNDNDLIADSISSLNRYIEETLEDHEHQEAITRWILNTFQSNSPKIFYLLLQLSEMNLSKVLRGRIRLDSLAREITQLIERNVKDGTISLKAISKELTRFIHDNIPEISKILYDQLNLLIEKQGPIKRNILKLATWTFDFDQDTLEGNLYEMVSSPSFRYQIYDYLEQGINRFNRYLNSEEGTKEFNRYYQRMIVELNERIRSKGVPFLLAETEKFLQKDTSWKKIEVYLKKVLGFTRESLEELIVSEKFDRLLSKSMPVVLEKIKVSSIVTEKVKAYDTNKLEKMIQDATGEHLSAIEVLGGVLGGFAGIALFNPLLFVYILCPIAVLGLVEYLMTARQRRKTERERR
ncbi:MAG: DUF445 family protein [Proteobacteria bacterium]|nr:DUF445 family protein [Pseudomonadota bacterium]